MKTRKSSKEKTTTLFNRYVWLVDLVYRSGGITFEEINRRWCKASLNEEGEELPLRTFHNHRAAIEEMFDVMITCNKRDGYKYYIDNSEDMERGGVRTWLLNTFSINNLINESHKLKRRILFEHIPSGQRYLAPIIEAMRDQLTLTIGYQSFGRDEPNSFEIEPFCVKIFKQRWYVVARSPYKKALLIYALDRIQHLQITEKPYKFPQDFQPETFFEYAFGIMVEQEVKPCLVRLKVRGNQRKYLRSLPLHPSQEEANITENDSVFTYYLAPTYDFKQEILAQGEHIQVLEPEWFAKEIKESHKAALDLYE